MTSEYAADFDQEAQMRDADQAQSEERLMHFF
jgi:hypothetical protein